MVEDKRVCPKCGHSLHSRPYLMSQAPGRIAPEARRFGFAGGLVFGFLILVFLFHLLSTI